LIVAITSKPLMVVDHWI